MTNYLDPVTNADAQQVIDAGGSALQLGVDGNYSFLMFALSFIEANFGLILIVGLITLVVGLLIRKWMKAGKGTAKIA